MTTFFAPNALPLSWTIMIGQLLVGLAVMFGLLTNFALLWGIFMNLNFILAGQVTPSAFYIVIQIALFAANAGVVFGLDRFVSRRLPHSLLTAQPRHNKWNWRFEKVSSLLLAIIAFAAGLAAIPFIRDYGPHSVDDPAMLLFVLSVIAGQTMLLKSHQIRSAARVYRAPSQSKFILPEIVRSAES